MEPFFSLFAEDNENYRNLCESVREHVSEFSPKNLKIENLISEIAHAEWDKIARFIEELHAIDFRMEINTQFEEPVTNLEQLNEILLNTPITSLLFLCNAENFVRPYRFAKDGSYSENLKDFEIRLSEEGTQLTQEGYGRLFDQTS